MTTAAELYALQEIDLANDSAVAKLNEVEAQLGESEELIAARSRVKECREQVRAAQETQKSRDWDAEEIRGKVAEIEGKLYGGSVRNPKELEDLEADLKSLRGQLSKREDALLEAMMALEEGEAELSQAEQALADIEGLWKAEQGTLENTRAELKEEIASLEAKRAGQIESMDAAALSLYQAIRERRGGTGVALVERGLCQGCRISLPMSVLQKARAGMGLVQCVSCERILLVS